MRCLLLFTILISAPGLLTESLASPGMPEANWQRAAAGAAGAGINIDPVLTELLDLAISAPAGQSLVAIEALLKRTDWPLPAREKTLYEFTRELRFKAPFSVPMPVLQFLQAYQSRVLVPHRDHPNSAVPLYPVRAAASGLRNHWTRNQARTDASQQLDIDPVGLIQAYLAAGDRAVKAGIEDAVMSADSIALLELTAVLAALPGEARELSVFTAKTAIAAGDNKLLATSFYYLPRADQGQLLRLAAEHLDPADSATLLSRIIADAPAATAALAIGSLAPSRLKFAPLEKVLLETLTIPELTTTAALALARYGSASAIQDLRIRSRSADNPAMARRIQLVLDSAGSNLPGQQP